MQPKRKVKARLRHLSKKAEFLLAGIVDQLVPAEEEAGEGASLPVITVAFTQ